MTTVAFDGKIFAADRRMTSSGQARTTQKLFDVGEYIFAMVGDAAEGVRVADWIRKGQPQAEKPKVTDNCILGLAVKKADRTIWVVEDDSLTFVPILGAFHAEGSGRDYAMAAMALGRTAKEAVELAMQFDVGTGGDIDVIEVP